MFNLLIKSLYIIVPLILGMGAYYIFDEENIITNEISKKIKVDKKWQPSIVIICASVMQITFGVVCMYFINISTTAFFILNGFIMGIVIGFTNRSQNQSTDKKM